VFARIASETGNEAIAARQWRRVIGIDEGIVQLPVRQDPVDDQ
jgi:hypothetical protein